MFGNWCIHAWHDHTTIDSFELYPQSSQQNTPYHEEHQSTPYHQSHPTHHLDHMMLHPIQPCLICNSNFPGFTTVQQSWSNTTLINLPELYQCIVTLLTSLFMFHLISFIPPFIVHVSSHFLLCSIIKE